MQYRDREGNLRGEDDFQDRFLKKIYHSQAGRGILRPFLNPAFSKAAGKVLDSRLSAAAVPFFMKLHDISLADCPKKKFVSFNDFFTRKRIPAKQERDERLLTSPCDAKLCVYRITENLKTEIKGTDYRMDELLRDKKLSAKYSGGLLFVFRLTVKDYHRYCYVDSGYQSGYRKIKGVLHTVNPSAAEVCPIYKENSREYSILVSDHFGRILMMEVGAMMVGKIANRPGKRRISRFEEKGHFEFGGSTVILMFEKGRVVPDCDILANSDEGYETAVRQGERIGTAVLKIRE